MSNGMSNHHHESKAEKKKVPKEGTKPSGERMQGQQGKIVKADPAKAAKTP